LVHVDAPGEIGGASVTVVLLEYVPVRFDGLFEAQGLSLSSYPGVIVGVGSVDGVS
jgi:hypothetical protein